MLAFQVTCFGCVCFPSINIYAFEMALMLMESKFWNCMCDYLQSWIWNAKHPAGRKKPLPNVKISFRCWESGISDLRPEDLLVSAQFSALFCPWMNKLTWEHPTRKFPFYFTLLAPHIFISMASAVDIKELFDSLWHSGEGQTKLHQFIVEIVGFCEPWARFFWKHRALSRVWSPLWWTQDSPWLLGH